MCHDHLELGTLWEPTCSASPMFSKSSAHCTAAMHHMMCIESYRVPHHLEHHIVSSITSCRVSHVEYHIKSNITSSQVSHLVDYHIISRIKSYRGLNIISTTTSCRVSNYVEYHMSNIIFRASHHREYHIMSSITTCCGRHVDHDNMLCTACRASQRAVHGMYRAS